MDEPQQLDLAVAAGLPVADVLGELDSSDGGLSSVEAGRRLAAYGPNVLLWHGVSALSVLVRQLRSYLLLLLLFAAVVSAAVGDRTEALIIVGIMAMSVGLSFFNEYPRRRPSRRRVLRDLCHDEFEQCASAIGLLDGAEALEDG
jgi:P-type Mg2+ transporter